MARENKQSEASCQSQKCRIRLPEFERILAVGTRASSSFPGRRVARTRKAELSHQRGITPSEPTVLLVRDVYLLTPD